MIFRLPKRENRFLVSLGFSWKESNILQIASVEFLNKKKLSALVMFVVVIHG